MNKPRDIWKAFVNLFSMLQYGCNKERAYQEFFEEYTVVFDALGVDKAISYEKGSSFNLPKDEERDYTYEPDFIAVNQKEGVVSVIDLKTPFVGELTSKKYKGARTFLRQRPNEYVEQVTRYVNFISGERKARAIIKKDFELEEINSYKAKLVYGLRSDNNGGDVEKILSERKIPTEIIFYDDVLNNLAKLYESCGRSAGEEQGWYFALGFYLVGADYNEKKYIFDYGEGDRNRISFCVKDNSFLFEIYDSFGTKYSLVADVNGPGPFFSTFEFANSDAGFCMVFTLDDEEQEIMNSRRNLELEVEYDNMVLGASSNRDMGASFFSLITLNRGGSLTSFNKAQVYSLYLRLLEEEVNTIYFEEDQYLVSLPGEDAMIAEYNQKRPWHVKWKDSYCVSRFIEEGARFCPKSQMC